MNLKFVLFCFICCGFFSYFFFFNHVEVQPSYILQSDFRGFLFQRILRFLFSFSLAFLLLNGILMFIPVIIYIYIYILIFMLCAVFWMSIYIYILIFMLCAVFWMPEIRRWVVYRHEYVSCFWEGQCGVELREDWEPSLFAYKTNKKSGS